MSIKKISILAILGLTLVLSSRVAAQRPLSLEQKMAAADTLYKLIDRYSKTAQLKAYDKNTATREAANKYGSLFEPGAIVVDEIKPTEMGKRINRTTTKTIDQYIEDALDFFPGGLQVKITKASIDFKNLANDTVTIAIEKIVSGKAPNPSGIGTNLYKSTTRQLLYVYLTNDFTQARIVKATSIGGDIICDDCNTTTGAQIETKGTKYKTFFEFDLTLMADGGLSSSLMNAPDYNKLNYQGLVTDSTKSGTIKNKVGFGAGAHLSFDFMFGRKRNVGFAIAGAYQYQGSTITLNSLDLQYEGYNPTQTFANGASKVAGNEGATGSFNFLRINQASAITEKLATHNAGISLLFKYQSDMEDGKKVGFFFEAGPTYYLFNQTVSKFTATANQFANYQIDPQTLLRTYVPSGASSSRDIIYSDKTYKGNVADRNQSFSDWITKLQTLGLMVSNQTSVTGTSQTANFQLAMGGELAAGALINLSDKFQFLAGANINVIYYSGNSLVTSDPSKYLADSGYNSLLNAMDKAMKVNYGLTLGIKYRVYKN